MRVNTKEWIQYSSAIAMIVSGIMLAFISFFIRGDVTDGVLFYLAQALTFAGAVYGLNIYFRTKLGAAETSVKEYIDEQIVAHERKRRRAQKTDEIQDEA